MVRSSLVRAVAVAVTCLAVVQGRSEEKNDSKFRRSVVASLNVTQLQYENWAAGGEDAFSYVAQLSGDLELKDTRTSWQFNGKLVFGQTKFGNGELRNSSDQIDLDTALSHRLNRFVNPFFGATLRTQFTTGYDYKKKPPRPRSDFADPLILTQTIGANLTASGSFRSRLGVGLKETFTKKYSVYSDDPKTPEIERRKIEAGISSASSWKWKLAKTVVYDSRLRLFSTFQHIDVVDVQWDNVFTAQIAKYVAVNLTVNVLYDKDVSLRTQIRQQLGVGLTYNLF